MIDIENYVVNNVRQMLNHGEISVQVYSAHVRKPSVLPCVMIYESDNSTSETLRFSDGEEHFAEVRYTVEICTNNSNGKKENAKHLAATVDDAMRKMGFYRATKQFTFDTSESTIFIILMAYRGLIECDRSNGNESYIIYRR